MAGHYVLAGGAEFGGSMAEVDLSALELAGGVNTPIVIIPTAAVPDSNHARAGGNGVRWFQSLGASNVQIVPLLGRRDSLKPEVVTAIEQAGLIYILGGFTHYLGTTLRDSAACDAMERAHQRGAVIAGSSAGAMVMCAVYFHPGESRVYPGLGFVPGSCMLPHHNTFGRRWVDTVRALAPQMTLIGIDEETGIIDDGDGGTWRVLGSGQAVVYEDERVTTLASGDVWRP